MQKPVLRYVYLANDPSDVKTMGGTANNTYVTAQAAFDAAVVLATATPTAMVIISVGPGGAYGNVAVNTALTDRIVWCGTTTNSSAIGTYTSTSPANISPNSYTGVTHNFMNITVGNMTFSANPTNIALCMSNCICGSITWNSNSNISPNSITLLFARCNNLVTGALALTGSINGPGSLLTFSNCGAGIIFGNVTITNTVQTQVPAGTPQIVFNGTYTNNSTGTGDTVNLFNNCFFSGAFTIGNNNNGQIFTVTFNNCVFGSTITISHRGNASNRLTLSGCYVLGLITLTSITGLTKFINCSLNKITNMPANTILANCALHDPAAATPVVNGIATGCEFYRCSITGGSQSLSNGSAVNVKFTSGLSSFKAANNVNVTLT